MSPYGAPSFVRMAHVPVLENPTRILVIDPDQRSLARARRVLEAAGYEVQTFDRTGPRLARALDSLPDLILMELELPDGGGPELFRSFRDLPDLQGVPVIFFSGADEASLRRAVVESGVAGYIPKRTLAGELVDAIGRYLEGT